MKASSFLESFVELVTSFGSSESKETPVYSPVAATTPESAREANPSKTVTMSAKPKTPTQHFGSVRKQVPIGLPEEVRKAATDNLNQVLADTISLRDMYKKHHWQVSGPTFYQLHLLFDKHFDEQSELVDGLAERIQALGGVSIAMAADVAETTKVPRPPKDREDSTVQIERLLEAHRIVVEEARAFAKHATEAGDDGTNDLLVSDIVRTNEQQVWFLSEHLQ
jgi:starvation-inducible DNA-binding protein